MQFAVNWCPPEGGVFRTTAEGRVVRGGDVGIRFERLDLCVPAAAAAAAAAAATEHRAQSTEHRTQS